MLFIRIAHVFSKHNDGIVEFKNEWKRFTTAFHSFILSFSGTRPSPTPIYHSDQ